MPSTRSSSAVWIGILTGPTSWPTVDGTRWPTFIPHSVLAANWPSRVSLGMPATGNTGTGTP